MPPPLQAGVEVCRSGLPPPVAVRRPGRWNDDPPLARWRDHVGFVAAIEASEMPVLHIAVLACVCKAVCKSGERPQRCDLRQTLFRAPPVPALRTLAWGAVVAGETPDGHAFLPKTLRASRLTCS